MRRGLQYATIFVFSGNNISYQLSDSEVVFVHKLFTQEWPNCAFKYALLQKKLHQLSYMSKCPSDDILPIQKCYPSSKGCAFINI